MNINISTEQDIDLDTQLVGFHPMTVEELGLFAFSAAQAIASDHYPDSLGQLQRDMEEVEFTQGSHNHEFVIHFPTRVFAQEDHFHFHSVDDDNVQATVFVNENCFALHFEFVVPQDEARQAAPPKVTNTERLRGTPVSSSEAVKFLESAWGSYATLTRNRGRLSAFEDMGDRTPRSVSGHALEERLQSAPTHRIQRFVPIPDSECSRFQQFLNDYTLDGMVASTIENSARRWELSFDGKTRKVANLFEISVVTPAPSKPVSKKARQRAAKKTNR